MQHSTLQAQLGSGGGGGGGAGTSYVGSGHFYWFKILNFNIFGGFQKNEYYFGYGDCEIFFWVITKLDFI